MTELGKEFVKLPAYKNGAKPLLSGEHYIVQPKMCEGCIVFGEDAGALRHQWVLEKKPRPEVPIIEKLLIPKAGASADYNARYCSLFFRPWTLFGHIIDVDVPRLSMLGVPASKMSPEDAASATLFDMARSQCKKLRLTKKQAAAVSPTVGNCTRFNEAWSEYLAGNVCSENSARLIRTFLIEHHGSRCAREG